MSFLSRFLLKIFFFLTFLTFKFWFHYLYFHFGTLLKLVSATLFFHQMIPHQKLWKIHFISYKKLFSFSRYSNFCFPSPLFFSESVIALKELRNCILCFISVRSLFFSVRVYKSTFSAYDFGKTNCSSFCVLVLRVSVSLGFNF